MGGFPGWHTHTADWLIMQTFVSVGWAPLFGLLSNRLCSENGFNSSLRQKREEGNHKTRGDYPELLADYSNCYFMNIHKRFWLISDHLHTHMLCISGLNVIASRKWVTEIYEYVIEGERVTLPSTFAWVSLINRDVQSGILILLSEYLK